MEDYEPIPPSNQTRNATLFAAAALSVALWLIPGGNYVALPLVYLNTLFHEMCHALASILSGGNVLRIEIFTDGGGVTLSQGGFGLLISSAGYVGASMMGAGLIAAGKTAKSAKTALAAFAVLILIGMLLWIRGGFGLGIAAFWVLALGISVRFLKPDALKFAAMFLGMQQCLNAVQSLLVLLQINAVQNIRNDAAIASEEFGLPPMAYALMWSGFSFLLMGLALRRAWSGSSNSPAE